MICQRYQRGPAPGIALLQRGKATDVCSTTTMVWCHESITVHAKGIGRKGVEGVGGVSGGSSMGVSDEQQGGWENQLQEIRF